MSRAKELMSILEVSRRTAAQIRNKYKSNAWADKSDDEEDDECLEQKVVIDEPVLNEEQSAKVSAHLHTLNEEYHRLAGTLHECVHEAADYKKRKIHKMIDHVVAKQKELGLFHKNFKK